MDMQCPTTGGGGGGGGRWWVKRKMMKVQKEVLRDKSVVMEKRFTI